MGITTLQNKVQEDNIVHNTHYYNRLIKLLKWCDENYDMNHLRYSRSRPNGLELHHIVPRSWNGSNENKNLIMVPCRVHFLIHHLMYKSFYTNKPMITAFYLLSNVGDIKLTSKQYKILREQFIELLSEANKGEKSHWFNKTCVINKQTDGYMIISTDDYKNKNYPEGYEHSCLGITRSEEMIEQFKQKFKTGELVSARKNRVMAIDTLTGESVLVDKEVFYNDDRYIGISEGTVRSDEHKRIVSENMKTIIRTDVQKQSAKKMMENLMENRITCDCCGRIFDIGNYAKHIKGISNKGKKYSEEIMLKMKQIKKNNIAEFGTPQSIYLLTYNNVEYITYDIIKACEVIGISKPTFRKRFKSMYRKLGTHRNRVITKTLEDFEVTKYEIFEDLSEID